MTTHTTPKHKDSPNSTLDWIESSTPVPGYKASTKYPGWYWRKKDDIPTTPLTIQEMYDLPTGAHDHAFDTTPPADLSDLTPTAEATTLEKLISQEADLMIDELLAGGVELIPAPEPKHAGHMIRQSSNPQWYRSMYHDGYTSRDATLNALARIVQGKTNSDCRYDTHLLNVIEHDRLPAIMEHYPHLTPAIV